MRIFLTVECYFSESFLVSIFALFASFSSRCFAFSWSSSQFQIAHQSLCSFRFTRLRLLCVSMVLTLVTFVSIDTRHLCLLDAAVRHHNRAVHRLNLVLDLCNVFLFDVNLQGLLHKFLLLFHATTSRCAACSWIHNAASQDSCRSWHNTSLSHLCDLFKIDMLKLDYLLGVLS